MIILISQREEKNKHGDRIDSLESNYIEYLSDRFTVIPVPNNLDAAKKLFNLAEGIILTGGGDIDEHPNRNKVENELIKLSIEKNIPLLGICRGFQLINQYFGGNLSRVDNHVRVKHKIKLTNPHKDEEHKKVNSYHNYGITKENLADDLEVHSVSEGDEVIESFYHKKYKIKGVQWHPERDNGVSKWIDDSFFKWIEES